MTLIPYNLKPMPLRRLDSGHTRRSVAEAHVYIGSKFRKLGFEISYRTVTQGEEGLFWPWSECRERLVLAGSPAGSTLLAVTMLFAVRLRHNQGGSRGSVAS